MLLRFIQPVLFALLGFWLGAATLASAPALPEQSPFLPPASAAAPTGTAPSDYDFVGMTTVGPQTLVSVRRQSDHRSLWIPVGKSVAEITVVAYDAAKDEITIRTPEATLTLPLHKTGPIENASSTTGSRPAPVAILPAPPPVGIPAKPLSIQEEKEMEARMLVTDLLEIGQQQRKAYEEAQRQAAAKAAAAKTKPAPATTSSALTPASPAPTPVTPAPLPAKP